MDGSKICMDESNSINALSGSDYANEFQVFNTNRLQAHLFE